jgi:DNA-binding transcriptional ArsR family regulator
MSIVTDIYEFNKQAGLLDKEMDSFSELAYVFEEAFEGLEEAYNKMDENGERYKPDSQYYPTARQLGLSLANSIKDSFDRNGFTLPTEVQEFDKSIDAVVFHIGKLAKMGLTTEQIERGFKAVSNCNMNKLTGPKDEHGKQLKPEGWTGPEEELQKILDERGR